MRMIYLKCHNMPPYCTGSYHTTWWWKIC